MPERKVCGLPCEVYSRVVGYFRPIQNWNPGKREEFEERKPFNIQMFANEEKEEKSETKKFIVKAILR